MGEGLAAFAWDAFPPLDQAFYLILIGYGSARIFKNASYWTQKLGIFVMVPLFFAPYFMAHVYAINKETWSLIALVAFILGFIQKGAKV